MAHMKGNMALMKPEGQHGAHGGQHGAHKPQHGAEPCWKELDETLM